MLSLGKHAPEPNPTGATGLDQLGHKTRSQAFVMVGIAVVAFVGGLWYQRTRSEASDVRGATAPAHHMHGVASAGDGEAGEAGWSPVCISSARQRTAGVQVQPVVRSNGTRELRYLGHVVPEETAVFTVNAGISGVIHDVAPLATGTFVRSRQVLGSFVAPDALPAIQLFILNSGARDRARMGPQEGNDAAALASANLRQRLDQLEALGVSREQLKEIADSGLFPAELRILSPGDGVILSRNVTPGLKFEKGAEFFRIANLRKVWIVADVFEAEARQFRPGSQVQVSVPGLNKLRTAVVSNSTPSFDSTGRVLKIRLETDNSDGALVPDMFVDLKLSVPYANTLAVPSDALLDTGLRKTVFVETGDCVLEPREVETGWRFGHHVEILKGLSAGEKVVTSGTFLVASESRIRPASGAAAAPTEKTRVKPEAGDETMPPGHMHHH